MAKVFQPKISFHDSKTGAISSVTIDDATLNSIESPGKVELKFDYNNLKDVDSDGNVTFADKYTVLDDIGVLINSNLIIERPIIVEPEYNLQSYTGYLRTSPFQAKQGGVTHIYTEWEFSRTGDFTDMEKVTISTGDLTKVEKAFSVEEDVYVRVRHVGRTSSGSITKECSPIKIISARPQSEIDFETFVNIIENKDIGKGWCSLPRMAFNLGWIRSEGEYNISHGNRLKALFKIVTGQNYSGYMNVSSPSGMQPMDVMSAHDIVAQADRYDLTFNITSRGSQLYLSEGMNYGYINNIQPINIPITDRVVSFNALYVDIVLNCQGFYFPIHAGFREFIHIDKGVASGSEDTRFFNGKYDRGFYISYSRSPVSRPITSGGVGILMSSGALYDVTGSMCRVSFLTESDGTLGEDSFLNLSEFKLKVKIESGKYYDIDFDVESSVFSPKIEKVSSSGDEYLYKININPNGTSPCNVTERIKVKVTLKTSKGPREFFLVLKVGSEVEYPGTYRDTGIVISYEKDGVRKYKLLNDSDSFVGWGWCDDINRDYRVEGFVTKFTRDSLLPVSGIKNYILNATIYQISVSGNKTLQTKNIAGRLVSECDQEILNVIPSGERSNTLFFYLNNAGLINFSGSDFNSGRLCGFSFAKHYCLGWLEFRFNKTLDGVDYGSPISGQQPGVTHILYCNYKSKLVVDQIKTYTNGVDGVSNERIRYQYDIDTKTETLSRLSNTGTDFKLTTLEGDNNSISVRFRLVSECDCGKDHPMISQYGLSYINGSRDEDLVAIEKKATSTSQITNGPVPVNNIDVTLSSIEYPGDETFTTRYNDDIIPSDKSMPADQSIVSLGWGSGGDNFFQKDNFRYNLFTLSDGSVIQGGKMSNRPDHVSAKGVNKICIGGNECTSFQWERKNDNYVIPKLKMCRKLARKTYEEVVKMIAQKFGLTDLGNFCINLRDDIGFFNINDYENIIGNMYNVTEIATMQKIPDKVYSSQGMVIATTGEFTISSSYNRGSDRLKYFKHTNTSGSDSDYGGVYDVGYNDPNNINGDSVDLQIFASMDNGAGGQPKISYRRSKSDGSVVEINGAPYTGHDVVIVDVRTQWDVSADVFFIYLGSSVQLDSDSIDKIRREFPSFYPVLNGQMREISLKYDIRGRYEDLSRYDQNDQISKDIRNTTRMFSTRKTSLMTLVGDIVNFNLVGPNVYDSLNIANMIDGSNTFFPRFPTSKTTGTIRNITVESKGIGLGRVSVGVKLRDGMFMSIDTYLKACFSNYITATDIKLLSLSYERRPVIYSLFNERVIDELLIVSVPPVLYSRGDWVAPGFKAVAVKDGEIVDEHYFRLSTIVEIYSGNPGDLFDLSTMANDGNFYVSSGIGHNLQDSFYQKVREKYTDWYPAPGSSGYKIIARLNFKTTYQKPRVVYMVETVATTANYNESAQVPVNGLSKWMKFYIDGHNFKCPINYRIPDIVGDSRFVPVQNCFMDFVYRTDDYMYRFFGFNVVSSFMCTLSDLCKIIYGKTNISDEERQSLIDNFVQATPNGVRMDHHDNFENFLSKDTDAYTGRYEYVRGNSQVSHYRSVGYGLGPGRSGLSNTVERDFMYFPIVDVNGTIVDGYFLCAFRDGIDLDLGRGRIDDAIRKCPSLKIGFPGRPIGKITKKMFKLLNVPRDIQFWTYRAYLSL